MLSQNYKQLIERLSRVSGLAVEDIDRRVEAKRAKLSGLISKEGAVQIIASELGFSFDKQKLKISELVADMKKVNTVGKIINLDAVREYNKNNKQGKIASMVIADDSANIRTVLWDTNHISLIESGKIKHGDVVEVSNGSIRNNELHLTSFSDIKLSNEKINEDELKKEKIYVKKKISQVKTGDNVKLRGFVLQIFEPRFFEVCPECKKGIDSAEKTCKEHGKIAPLKRALLNLVVDDGSETIRAVLFNEQIGKMILEDEINNTELFLKKKNELIGNELFFLGNIRQNKVFNTPELIVEDINEFNIDMLIKELETK